MSFIINLINPYFVLCQTQSPANIGSCARALSVMGFQELLLCKPNCLPNEETYRLACHAHPIIEKMKVHESLSGILKPTDYVIGLSNRSRFKGPRTFSLSEGINQIQKSYSQKESQRLILLFGSESSGLNNEELSLCNELWTIETFNKDYGSLNLAQAVQVVSYKLARFIWANKNNDCRRKENLDLKEETLSYQPLDLIIESLVHSDKLSKFMNKTTPEHSKKRFLNILKNGIKNNSDMKFILGFLKLLEKENSV